MCEWLACGDWCDVRLMCGGRFFNAHRAVLASVSNFLRRVLLSCPVDESPVYIFLPEFDLDAMSSVLYYIYNGEVWIPTHKIKMFLDIIYAMEIFIEQQYVNQADYKQYSFRSKNNFNICQLRAYNGINGCLVNARKGMKSDELIRQVQEPIVSLEACDKFIQTFRWSVENIPDLTSLSRYQKTKSYLLDIFKEAVRQEGTVNGQTPGVLAISNKEYHKQASGRFSNATVNHSSKRKTLSDTPKNTLGQHQPKTAIFDFLKQLQDKDCVEKNKGNLSISYTVCNQLINNAECILENNSNKEHNIDSCKRYTPLEISIPLMSRGSTNFPIKTHNSFFNLSHKPQDVTSDVNVKSAKVPKVTIFNEVLQSPWHPRQPHSYRPYRKKDLNSEHVDKNKENKTNVSSFKDDNNNSGTQFKTNAEPISSERKKLRCVVCQDSQVFTRKQDYTIHMRQHSSMNRYSCEECQKTFSQLRNFKYHMSVHRGTKEFAASCSVCGKNFNDRGYLSNHMKIHRNRKEYKCASCPKSFNQRVAFNMLVRIHTGVKPHVCEECGKAFSRKMLLKQHQRTHSGERPYACAHCDKRFADRSNMTLHLRLHTGVKPFSCTLCSKSFTKKHHLKSHLNFHTGAKPYTCPRCKLAFTQSSNMRTHYKKCSATS